MKYSAVMIVWCLITIVREIREKARHYFLKTGRVYLFFRDSLGFFEDYSASNDAGIVMACDDVIILRHLMDNDKRREKENLRPLFPSVQYLGILSSYLAPFHGGSIRKKEFFHSDGIKATLQSSKATRNRRLLLKRSVSHFFADSFISFWDYCQAILWR